MTLLAPAMAYAEARMEERLQQAQARRLVREARAGRSRPRRSSR